MSMRARSRLTSTSTSLLTFASRSPNKRLIRSQRVSSSAGDGDLDVVEGLLEGMLEVVEGAIVEDSLDIGGVLSIALQNAK